MTLDLLGTRSHQIKFLEQRIWGAAPVDFTGVILLGQETPPLLNHYIYIVDRDARELSVQLLESRSLAVLLPASLKQRFPLEQFSCDVAVYDDGIHSARELQRLVDSALAEERRMRDFTLRLTHLLLKGADIPAILSCAGVELGNPVYVLDPSGRLLFHCGLTQKLGQADPIVADLLSQQGISPTLYAKYSFTKLQNRLIQELSPFFTAEKDLLPRLYYRIMDQRTYLGHIALLSAKSDFASTDKECVRLLAEILTLKMKETTERGQPFQQENLLHKLLDGSIESAEQLASAHAESAALLKAELRLLVIELDPDTQQMEDVSGNYLLMSRQHLIEWCPTIRYVCLFQRHIVALLEESNVSSVLERLPQFLSSYGLFCAVSNQMSGVFPLRSYYRQGVELLRFCQADPNDEEKRLALFPRLYCRLLLEPAFDQGRAQEFILPEWLRLLRYDSAHRTTYTETLYTYLITGSLAATANRLHVHKNTLIYRLEKVREIAGCNLDNEEVQHQLYLSYLLLEALRREGKDPDLFSGITPSI